METYESPSPLPHEPTGEAMMENRACPFQVLPHEQSPPPPLQTSSDAEDDFDNDVDALLEEGLCAPKKRRMEEKYGGDSDHPSDGETSVQPMMTKIKTVLKSESLTHPECFMAPELFPS